MDEREGPPARDRRDSPVGVGGTPRATSTEGPMILACNYEEVTALSHGARALLGESFTESYSAVAAPTEAREAVEAILPLLTGDLSFSTLAEQQVAEMAVDSIVEHLRETMEVNVAATHPAAEEAVAAYFEFAHALSVLSRLQELGAEMRALLEVMTGRPVDAENAETFHFPD
jgi:hypothetical protein